MTFSPVLWKDFSSDVGFLNLTPVYFSSVYPDSFFEGMRTGGCSVCAQSHMPCYLLINLLRIELAIFKPKVFNLKKATHFFFGNHNLPFSFSLFFSLPPSFPHFQSTYWICTLSYFWIFLLFIPYWELWKDSWSLFQL